MNSLDIDDVYKRYADVVYRYLIVLCGNADLAEELTQETFFRAVKHAGSFDGKAKVTTWLCTIAKNKKIIPDKAAITALSGIFQI
ncbi:MAG: RNA polymerase sigma factor [Oscillospiraceae bacterium]